MSTLVPVHLFCKIENEYVFKIHIIKNVNLHLSILLVKSGERPENNYPLLSQLIILSIQSSFENHMPSIDHSYAMN